MLTLVTGNPAKYEPFSRELERMRVVLSAPKTEVPELQCTTFAEALGHKARVMAENFGHPVLVDDAGIVLDAYRPFPGPLTSVVLRGLGRSGLQRLMTGVSDLATMECHLGWWDGAWLKQWSGTIPGRLDPTRTPKNPLMPLSDWFLPDAKVTSGKLAHREQALSNLRADAFELHLQNRAADPSPLCETTAAISHQCPFCIEIEGTGDSIFGEMMGTRLASRVLYQDEDFVVMPPLGEFIEGGLLVLSRRHVLSFAFLEPEKLTRLAQLVRVIRQQLLQVYGVSPLVFEHGPAPQRTKGVCCVDHAHLNIFPAGVRVHPQLAERMSMPLCDLQQLSLLARAEFGYLVVQENDGSIRAYDGQLVPTQLVRRIIANELGLAERWHWKDYPGCDELLATYHKLKDRIHL